MSNTNPYRYIHTGLLIRLLMHANTFSIKNIIDVSKNLKRDLKDIDFRVATKGLMRLNEFISNLEENEDDFTKIITEAQASALSKIMSGIEDMVFAEAQTKEIYILPETRFNIEHLMNNPEKLFSKDLFYKLTPIAIHDLAEGFQCIVHSRSTACAFHMLRGTEAVLKHYYFEKIKRNREKTPMWGNMVKQLQEKKKKNEKLLQRLDYIRINYRNPTAHPDEIYSFDTAQDLLGLCIDVINGMGKEIV